VTDPFAGSDQSFYRIARIDADGNAEYSQVILLRKNKPDENNLVMWPNPASDKINLVLPAESGPGDEWKLFASDGRMLKKESCESGEVNLQISIQELPPGVYLLMLRSGGKIWRGKVLKQ
jgi:hypothetical protein